MDQMNRREFAGASLAAMGAAALAGQGKAEETTGARLPTVRWGKHEIARVLVGHNPIKGGSHFSSELNRDMREWFSDREHGLELLRRCEQCGINAAQMGGKDIEALLRAHYAEGGRLKWIATFYSKPGNAQGKEELARILKMDPKPIGAQQFGNVGTYTLRGFQILVLELFPVQYTPATGKLSYYSELHVEIETTADNRNHLPPRGLPEDRELVAARVDNPEAIIDYPLSRAPQDQYDLLIGLGCPQKVLMLQIADNISPTKLFPHSLARILNFAFGNGNPLII